jgi:Ni,Fe-hydrogenase III small subunit/ferredoxin
MAYGPTILQILRNRLAQGHRTIAFPKGEVSLPERYRGRPELSPGKCPDGCRACVEACPTGAITAAPLALDLGKCLFCPSCIEACPEGAVTFTRDPRLATDSREALLMQQQELALARALPQRIRAIFGRSLKLRQVSAGGCNGCEADLNVLGINVFDLGRFGIQFVASPRHADGVVVTGPVSRNMELALRETFAATPAPKLLIAVGACAISGGPFIGSAQALDGVPRDLKVDLYIPGCPPHPITLLDGLLRVLDRL